MLKTMVLSIFYLAGDFMMKIALAIKIAEGDLS